MSKSGKAIFMLVCLLAVTLTYLVNAADAGNFTTLALRQAIKKILPLHKKMGKPQAGDWLAAHEEEGQTFSQYLKFDPVHPTKKRNVIYILPLGDFTTEQRKIINLTAEFMGAYFNLTAKVGEDIPLSLIPADARRVSWDEEQLLTPYILDEVLVPRVPKDGVACLALTASDLWPGKGWNFVFGQASLRERVGVFSLFRNGNPAGSEEDFKLCLLRTLKTATHETAHMFSLLHCIEYECNENGSNSREESDRKPLWLCPECMAKICWMAKADPVQRYHRLVDFCHENKLQTEYDFYVKSLLALGEKYDPNASAEKKDKAAQ
jgi:archaemetzincin